ncbi:type VI secretion system-associated FHA domain protein TagH [Paracoccus sp. SSJ]|uniref:type VI secretion system-associated FHA domain protein TagH n=1 Tax=Paracoccus sp. SSJ TaxID=3050636 RepID=UPI00254A4837|nr:type VI secretion system-associated FHA domain protein TagH [Paracoccus sp. SSJ]MDK8874868.1 type VI secretion system-associated FHA domain protein TagH [Paracoccus sp. SSJ]
MTLRLTVLASPVPQPQTELRLDSGRAELGREPGCDWQIDDPEMFVSRRHCIVEATAEGWTVTDTSTGGLFLDGAAEPLGPGRSAALRDGMRLRLGDVTLGVTVEAGAQAAAEAPDQGIGIDPFFAPRDPAPPPPPRPPELPEPFERTTGRFAPQPPPAPPPGFDDPFMLDPLPAAPPATPPQAGDDWSWGPAGASPPRPDPVPVMSAALPDSPPPAAPQPQPPSDAAAAFLRSAGLDPASVEGVDIEALGRRYRMLAEGLVALLRARAEEKGSLRVARTTLGAAQVNPLKFLAMPDEQVAALIAPRGAGYLDPDAAIAEAFRDLADHRMRSWHGLQAALRRMIDRFSPEAIEAQLADAGLLRALLAGGRSALLWDAYAARWAEIARAAEDRFLGEVGAEFRDAYETPDRSEP